MRRLIFLLCLLTACGPRSLDESKEVAQATVRSLLVELSQVHTTEELRQAEGRLKKLFDELVEGLIAAEERHGLPQEPLELLPSDRQLSDALRLELKRIYGLEEGRRLVENAQRDALHRLDAFIKRKEKGEQC